LSELFRKHCIFFSGRASVFEQFPILAECILPTGEQPLKPLGHAYCASRAACADALELKMPVHAE